MSLAFAIPARKPDRHDRAICRGGLILVALVALTLVAGSDPEVIPVHVPAKDVSKWFPPGTELRTLSPKDFEAQVLAAQRATAALRPAATPRLIRARHHARWASNRLTGRTELVLAPLANGPSEFPLTPWTPAILAAPTQTKILGARDSGIAVLRVDSSPNEQIIVLEWELQSLPNSNGRDFALGLPSEETTILELDLPQGWIASSQRGIRRKSLAAVNPGRVVWEVEGESGRFDVEINDQRSKNIFKLGSGAWVGGTTEIDLRRKIGGGGELANWITEWRMDLDARHPRQLEATLDPGLELIDVQGPAVSGYRIERSEPSVKVTVTLNADSPKAVVRFLAHDPVPPEGPWRIPAIQPIDAIWTGGRTTVILDDLHIIRECREESGRLISPSRSEGVGANRLTFEAESPRSVGQLVFLGPRAELTCGVRGQLFISGNQARVDCQLDWAIERGATPEVEVDLSPGWVPEQVQIQGFDDPIIWHPAVIPSGLTRLRVMLPAAILARKKWSMTVKTTSNAGGGHGPLDLPRIRAVSAAIIDEAWLSWVDDGTILRPTQAKGLSWIDAAEVPGLSTQASGTHYREALAWRWTADKAEARVERERIGKEESVSIRTRARVSPDGHKLTVEGTLLVNSGADPLDSLPIWIEQAKDSLSSWRFHDDGGVELALKPIERNLRDRLSLPSTGSTRGLAVKMPAHAQKTIHFEFSAPWDNQGSIPLLSAPAEFFRRGIILVETPAGMRSRTETQGLGRISPSVVTPTLPSADIVDVGLLNGERVSSQSRNIYAFSYKQPGSKLRLFTEPLLPSNSTAIIREAVLTTIVDLNGRSLNRLRLLAYLDPAKPLELSMPPQSTLVRVRIDGVEIEPIRSGSHLVLPPPVPIRGALPSSILIDFSVEDLIVSDGSRLHPRIPELRLPCLSFVWEIATSSGWKMTDCGPELIANDRDDPNSWPCGSLGVSNTTWNFMRGTALPSAAARLRLLDTQLDKDMPDTMTLAEWFTRWDAGQWPIVIDRLALDSAGLGPKSSSEIGRFKSDRRGVSLAALQQRGLTAVAFKDVLLITTETEAFAFSQSEQWVGAIGETLAWGTDRTDRFQTLARWREDASPRSAASGDDIAERVKLPPDWVTWRFSKSSWPESDSYVYLIDVQRRILMGWIVLAVLSLTWLLAGRRPFRGRYAIPALLSAICISLDSALPNRFASFAAGGFAGGLAILLYELGGGIFRWPALPITVARPQSSIQRVAARSALFLIVVGSLTGLFGFLYAQSPGSQSPIVALLPYDGAFDPSRPPDRVVLRLSDFTRLSRFTSDGPSKPATITATSAVHQIERLSPQSVIVESQFELSALGQGPFSWTFPVSFARDIVATLDGDTCSIVIESGGNQAQVLIPTAGNHILRLRRSVATVSDETSSEMITLPVNAVPTAKVLILPSRDRASQGNLLARGLVEQKVDQNVTGRLGPADRIVIRWPTPVRSKNPLKVGNVEGLVLWDAHPAGDRLRARLTYHMPREISTIQLLHEAGLILRSVHVPGRSEVYLEDSEDSQWVLGIDPPLPAEATLTIDCWRPSDAIRGSAGATPPASGRGGEMVRQIPRIQPMGVERFVGALGMRRPGDWSGRLEPRADIDPINDETFVKMWGNLPDETLTLSGTSRFSGELQATLRTGLAGSRVQVRPAVQIRIESGRMAVSVDAELIDYSGHFPITDLDLPETIRITEVSGDGLMDWATSSGQRLHLIWKRPGSGLRRHFRISGWIPLPEDPLKAGSRSRRARTPWFGWGTAEVLTGSLSIDSLVNVELHGATGVSQMPQGRDLLPNDTVGAIARGFSLEYQVNDPSHLGEMRWSTPPPRVAVTIESQMTLFTEFAEWVAVLRYDVSGGALDAIHLKMPASWAAQATLHPSGEDFQITSETRGASSVWSITPRRPFWGSNRFVVRSTIPLPADGEIIYPDLAPLGNNGAFDAYLGIVNATGYPLVSEGLTGLETIDYATRFRDREFSQDIGTPERAFHVLRNPWVLRTQFPRGFPNSAESQGEEAGIASTDLSLTVLPDQTTIGRAIYETMPETGHLLSFQLPPNSSIVWVVVDSNPTVPLQSGTGTWSIILDGHHVERVCVIWKTEPASQPRQSRSWSIGLPRAGAGNSRSILEVFTPPGISLQEVPTGFELASLGRIDMWRADGIAQSIRDLIKQLDRSSGRGHERLVSLMINHELALRNVQRGVRWSETGRIRSTDGSAQEQIAKVRSDLRDTVRLAGLANDQAAALGYLGESTTDVSHPSVRIPEPTAMVRPRAFGSPTGMIGTIRGLDETAPSVVLTLRRASSWLSIKQPATTLIVVIALLGAALLSTLGSAARVANLVAMTMALGVAAVAGGPTLLLGGLGVVGVAWKKGSRVSVL